MTEELHEKANKKLKELKEKNIIRSKVHKITYWRRDKKVCSWSRLKKSQRWRNSNWKSRGNNSKQNRNS